MSTLRKLILACVDDERLLRHESKLVDVRRAGVLQRLARERAGFVADLDRLEPHAQRRLTGSWIELLREAGRDVFVSIVHRISERPIGFAETRRL